MSFLGKLGSIAVKTGKVVAEGGKWAFNHSEEISNVTNAGVGMYDTFSDLSERRHNAKDAKEYFDILEKENALLKKMLEDTSQNITKQKELYDGKFKEMESINKKMSDDISKLKEESEKNTKYLNQQLKLIENYHKEMNTKFLIAVILSSVSIIAAIIAIIL